MSIPSQSLRIGDASGRRQVRVTLDGEELLAYEGDTIAAAILATGRRSLRRTALRNQPRGLFCGIGVCYECLMQVDGRPNVHACLTPVADGMQIETQHGAGQWGVEP